MEEEGRGYILTKDGRAVGALLPMEDYEAFSETFDVLNNADLMKNLKELWKMNGKEGFGNGTRRESGSEFGGTNIMGEGGCARKRDHDGVLVDRASAICAVRDCRPRVSSRIWNGPFPTKSRHQNGHFRTTYFQATQKRVMIPATEVAGDWCPSWSSKPANARRASVGRFDSDALPPLSRVFSFS